MKETIYDEQINPLMHEIIKICEENKIAFITSFHLPTEGDENLACTSCNLKDDANPPVSYFRAKNIIFGD